MYLARALVDRPDQVELRSQPADGGKLYELKVAPEDVGKVIGRDGRTVNAIRTAARRRRPEEGDEGAAGDPRRPQEPRRADAAVRAVRRPDEPA